MIQAGFSQTPVVSGQDLNDFIWVGNRLDSYSFQATVGAFIQAVVGFPASLLAKLSSLMVVECLPS